MPFTLIRIQYGGKCFTRLAINVCCKMFAHSQESVLDEEQPGRPVISTTTAMIAAVFFSYSLTEMKC